MFSDQWLPYLRAFSPNVPRLWMGHALFRGSGFKSIEVSLRAWHTCWITSVSANPQWMITAQQRLHFQHLQYRPGTWNQEISEYWWYGRQAAGKVGQRFSYNRQTNQINLNCSSGSTIFLHKLLYCQIQQFKAWLTTPKFWHVLERRHHDDLKNKFYWKLFCNHLKFEWCRQNSNFFSHC